MSDLRATNFKGRTSGSVPNMPDGVVVGSAVTISSSGIDVGVGVITATSFAGNITGTVTGDATGLTGTPNIDCGTGSFTGDVDIADKIIHTGDTNTAIRFPAADTFTVETGGSEALRVDNTQKVLINQTSQSVSHPLQVTAASDAHGIAINGRSADDIGELTFFENDQTTRLGELQYRQDHLNLRHRVGDIRFATGGTTERVRIDSNGKTGININNPGSYNSSGNELVLGNTSSNAGMTIVSNSSNNGHIFFADGTASGAQNRGIIKYEHANDAMAFNTAESERLRLTSGGDLLVGHGSVISNMKFGGSGDFGSHAEIIGANKGFANGLAILNYDATATIPAILKLATSRSDTNGTNTAVGDNDNCGGIQFMGNDGTRFIDVARIDGVTDGAPGTNDMPGRLMFLTTADGASVVTERMRITSTGKVRIKCANFDADPSASNAGLQLFDTSGGSITSAGSGTGGESHFVILNTNGVVGQIQSSGSGTTYATSSDHRLKENVVDLTGAIARVKQLAPKRFNFIADDTTMVDGFLAHEAQTVVPEAVTGTHNEVDGDGNPVIQGIDQAKLVPLLTAALKEAITKIETLETKVAALEAE